ncbi:MAG TPA: branched-chain amino acid ABC transporter substrate-binding protein [Anaerolineales bacterium]|nr:branched-chain amino acid ABC transporter substrate-binding protein [Anaerolineales bacterium]
MKRMCPAISVLLLAGLTLSACGAPVAAFSCTDRLGCVQVGAGEPLRLGTLLTLTTPDSPYGIDALRGVEIAVADKGTLLGHSIEIVQEDDLCSAEGGQAGATKLAADPKIVGVIGTSCSGASVSASRILSGAGSVLISPSSTAPSLTDPTTHDAGFLRTIYNDKAQGQVVAEFAFNVLGAQTMVTIHDGTAYAQQLQQAACDTLTQLGGQCLRQVEIQSGTDLVPVLQQIALDAPAVLFYPVYAVDGASITNNAALAGLENVILMSSDGLLSSDFIAQTEPASDGMYLSGPSTVKEAQAFLDQYQKRYGEAPIASYHLQGYDAATMLLNAVEKVAQRSGGSLYVGRQALRDALFSTRGMQGLSGPLNCVETGDCAQPNISIFQVSGGNFQAIYP